MLASNPCTHCVPAVRGAVHDVKEYPGASHAFMNDHDKADQPPLFGTASKLFGMRYDEPATADARARIVAFFGEHLAGPARPA